MAQVSMLKAFLLAFVMAILTVASAQVSEVPSPSPDAGAGFSVGVSTAAIGFSLIFLEMAELCFSKGIMIMFVAVVLSLTTTASAQDSAMAPAPSMDTGAAFSPAVSAIAVMFSVIVSLVALLKH
ncbi:hypothetical protein CXB51_001343 [Gossypium anomalum]|uniref:Uncharacterized protein n=1 Tax=Gossypium anomalum TaxID=47600 RepID=A0A8J5ZRQ2_9ROSI|nr:hypothetical protein CXB51_001343 [Gossypium anomalum]